MLLLAPAEESQKRLGLGIVGRAEFLNPLHHDLNVAQFAETAEQIPAGFLHLLPGGIGVDGHQAVGHGTATAQCDTKVMDRVGSEFRTGAFALLRNALHPLSKALNLLGLWRLF